MISRRSAIKLIASAITVPLIKLRESVPDEKLMLAFCDADVCRYDCSKPFGVGSLTYATDSRAMVRAEIVNRQECGEIKTPPCDAIWGKYWQPTGQWKPLTLEDIQPTIEHWCLCPDCGSRRIELPEYPDLSDPIVNARYHRMAYDVDDNSIRDTSCKTCRGSDEKKPSAAEILGVRHSTWFARRILNLPNAKVCRTQFIPEALLFVADGFEGVSLGVTK